MVSTTTQSQLGPMSRLVSGILSIRPLADFAKHQARQMMIKRAEQLGVPWREEAQKLRAQNLESNYDRLVDSNLTYPDYYLNSFHAYETGNLNWEAATELEVAAKAVHAKIWPEAGANGDTKLRQSYHDRLLDCLPTPPKDIVDLGCGVGLSTFALQATYPHARMTGVDLSPYFLAVAAHQSQHRYSKIGHPIRWVHAAAERTELPTASFDLVSVCLVLHELPQAATRALLQEARRLLRPTGHLAIMAMNPQSEVVAKMPPYVLTLLKSTEPWLDEYFSLDLVAAIAKAGFNEPTINFNSPRHRTVIASVAKSEIDG
ncbi:MAG: class I SAM-dependent methyltransferase [Cyanobacteriota bacterium]|nr:class I SAM-dependent methyltransferase [Cyanobacteriota bacterium]